MLKISAMRDLKLINSTKRLNSKNCQKKKISGKLEKLIHSPELQTDNKRHGPSSQKQIQWSKFNAHLGAKSPYMVAGRSPSSASKQLNKCNPKKLQFPYPNDAMPSKRLSSKKSLASIPRKSEQSVLQSRKTICNTQKSEMAEQLKNILNQREKMINQILQSPPVLHQKHASAGQFVLKNAVKIPRLNLQDIVHPEEYYPENNIATDNNDSQFDLSDDLFGPEHEESEACVNESSRPHFQHTRSQ